MASDTSGMWEHYVINWAGKWDMDALRREPKDEKHAEKLKQWAVKCDKWYRMYFDFRRPYEGQALFGLERL